MFIKLDLVKKRGITVFIFLISTLLFNVAQGQVNSVILNPTGGMRADGTDGIKIEINKIGRPRITQYGIFIDQQDFSNRLQFRTSSMLPSEPEMFSACYISGVKGAGTISDPWKVITSGSYNNLNGQNLNVTMEYIYVKNQSYFMIDFYVQAPKLWTTQTVHFYCRNMSLPGDFKGYRSTDGKTVGVIRSANDCSANNNIPWQTIVRKAAVPWTSYTVDNPAKPYPNSSLLLNNVVDNSCQPPDFGVHLNLGVFNANQIKAHRVLFGYLRRSDQGEYDAIPVVNPTTPGITSNLPVTVNFVNTSVSENEGNSPHVAKGIKIKVSNGVVDISHPLGVDVVGGTAIINSDFTFHNSFFIPPGDYRLGKIPGPTEFELDNITILGNTICNNNKTISLSLSNSCNNELINITNGKATYTILDDEVRASVNDINAPNVNIPYGTAANLKAFSAGAISSNAIFTWYASATGGLPLATGSSYNTTTLLTDKSYWVSISGRKADGTALCESPRKEVKVIIQPLAFDDAFTLLMNQSKKLDVLTNDIFSSTCTPVVTIVSGPMAGATAVVQADQSILYTAKTSYIGTDALKYRITCGTNWSEANATITVSDNPDNIITANCSVLPPQTIWDFDVKLSSNADLDPTQTPVVGDLDGDGLADIVVSKFQSTYISKDIYIYYGKNLNNPVLITTEPIYGRNVGSIAIAKVLINGSLTPLIITSNTDGYLRAYNPTKPAGSQLVWKSDAFSASISGNLYVSVHVADFNNDGQQEVYTSDRIFNAATGKLLVKGSGSSNKGLTALTYASPLYIHFSHAANVWGDNKLELLLGTQVYEVVLNDLTQEAGNQLNLVSSIPDVALSTGTVKDGATFAVDINQDGRLDVVTRTITTNKRVVVFAWDVLTQSLIADCEIIDTETKYPTAQASIPFVGDIDGDGKLELLLTTTNRLQILDLVGKKFVPRQAIAIQDESGGTGITLFDFNQDGIAELVYRDEQFLQVLDASTGVLVQKEKIACSSGTIFEYPIVADIDKDGHAEIITVGNKDGNVLVAGSLYIIKSKTQGTWAPARPVWNQYAYNVVNVNADLSIPKVQFNSTTHFSNGKQPFNNFLQQQTLLDLSGNPVFLAPRAEWTLGYPNYTYYADGDSMLINIKFANTGDASFSAPFFATVYKNSITAVNKLASARYDQNILPGKTAEFKLKIANFSLFNPITDLLIRLNDNGITYPIYKECLPTANVISKPYNNLLLANNDYVQAIVSNPQLINILLNDSLSTCKNAGLGLSIIGNSAQNGTASIVGNTIMYTPNTAGKDTINYQITCGNDVSEGTVFINIVKLFDNIQDATCFVKPQKQPWSIKESPRRSPITLSNQTTPLIGDIDGDGNVEIVTVDASPSVDESSRNIMILNADGSLKNSFTLQKHPISHNFSNVSALAKVKFGPNDYRYVILVSYTDTGNNPQYSHLYAYSPSGTLYWKLNNLPMRSRSPEASFADINNSGYAEILTSGYIVAAESGILLCKVGAGQNIGLTQGWEPNAHLAQAMLIDVWGDSKLEYVAGNKIYEVKITNRNDETGNSITEIRKCNSLVMHDGTTAPSTDGATQVVDFNLDGNLDVVVSFINQATKKMYIYVWSPLTQNIIASYVHNAAFKKSVPMIGDIDGDKYPEIVLMHGSGDTNWGNSFGDLEISALKFDKQSATKQLKRFWVMPHDDLSGSTAMTMFDFNQDGIMEIIYRDEKNLRIINGSGISHITGNDTIIGGKIIAYDMAVHPCYSPTAFEYPVVADIDNDGQAEIITTGYVTATKSNSGPIRIFESGGYPWAAGRKVWNQYAYNAVNINDDLTIPTYQIKPSTVFPGLDGIIGTSDDVRPYNGFLQQQTIISKQGVPLFVTPDYKILNVLGATGYSKGDSIVVEFSVKNIGEVQGSDPFYVSVYKNEPKIENKIAMQTYSIVPIVDETLSYKIVLYNASSILSQSIVIVINHKDSFEGTVPVYFNPECNYLNNISAPILLSDLLILFDDYVNVFQEEKFPIDFLVNDFLGTCTPGTIAVNIGTAEHGSTNLTGNKIEYTSAANYIGRDTVAYTATCTNNNATSNIYINILKKPSIILKDSCSFNPLLTVDLAYSGSTYEWRSSSDGYVSVISTNAVIYPTGSMDYQLTIKYGAISATVKVSFNVIRSFSLIDGRIWYESNLQ